MIKIAVQKSERITKGLFELFNKCGLKLDGSQSKLYCKFQELPIELYFVRGSDISALLGTKFDVAVLGRDSFLEYGLQNIGYIKKDLGFAKCRLAFASKCEENLNGKVIATSHSNILQKYINENRIDAEIIEMNGSVESAIELGIADIIFDIVQTGSTLVQHGLKEIMHVIDLEAVMVVKNGFESESLDKLLFRINAVLNGKHCKYIMFNLKKNMLGGVMKILPSGKSPTVIDLANVQYCAVHTLCNESEVWDICEKLRRHGAEDILVTDIDLRII